MNLKCLALLILSLIPISLCANPVTEMLDRIDNGASKKFVIELKKGDADFFELDQKGTKPVIRGNNWINIATGVNWYLKYYAGVHLSWNGMKATLPATLPAVTKKERHTTDLSVRYYLNYCTYSYSMAFWDWERWQQELDWMALHGINMPLAAVGTECVWKNVLAKLGYNKDEINQFIAGPAFLAWWEMNNLEGWGGPNPDSWYTQQEELQKNILKGMAAWGMKPVFPGYSGMVPRNAKTKLGINVEGDGIWNGFPRPAFQTPTDPRFNEFADLYYAEQKALFGTADYYSMDPFHEGTVPPGTDLELCGKTVLAAMKRVNPKAVWVVQGWDANPRPEMIKNLNQGDLLILDLFSECRPMWGAPSLSRRENGYEQHNWVFCMLLNFGGNVGLHGRMDQLINNFYLTKNNPLAKNLKGYGLTMEGIFNNAMMYELMSELIWRPEKINKYEWLKNYAFARYGAHDENIDKAWEILADNIYNCPFGNNQQGTHESIFCSRPSFDSYQASSWSKMSNYYDPTTTEDAARAMLKVADNYRGNNNFEYDLVDIVRQAIADHGRVVFNRMIAAFKSFDKKSFAVHSQDFLNMILLQDKLLATRSEFRVGSWIEEARNLGNTEDEKNLYEWNARVQITTWGARVNADKGKLRDYAHKEWSGLLSDFYFVRWKAYIDGLRAVLKDPTSEDNPLSAQKLLTHTNKQKLPKTVYGVHDVAIDYYAMEEPWTLRKNEYTSTPEGNPVDVAKEVFKKVFKR